LAQRIKKGTGGGKQGNGGREAVPTRNGQPQPFMVELAPIGVDWIHDDQSVPLPKPRPQALFL
jgi:hypothetical protein